jgi:hypothetical protein
MILKIPLLNLQQYKVLDKILQDVGEYTQTPSLDGDYLQVNEKAKKLLLLAAIEHGIVFEEVDSIYGL